jgi:integrase
LHLNVRPIEGVKWSTIQVQSLRFNCNRQEQLEWINTLVETTLNNMLKRRLKQAGLPAHYSPHSFRATGITNFLENDGTLEAAQRIAGHASAPRISAYPKAEDLARKLGIHALRGERLAFPP